MFGCDSRHFQDGFVWILIPGPGKFHLEKVGSLIKGALDANKPE